MPPTPVSLYPLSARWSYLELRTQFILQRTTSAALCLNSSLRDSEAPQHRRMLLEAVDQLVLFLAACKLYHMFLNPLVEITDIQITTAALIDLTKPLATLTVNHMPKVNLLSSNLRFQCTTADHQQLEAMEVLDRNNHNRLVMLLPRAMLAPLLNQCKVLFPVSR